jgi:hypothetical protein
MPGVGPEDADQDKPWRPELLVAVRGVAGSKPVAHPEATPANLVRVTKPRDRFATLSGCLALPQRDLLRTLAIRRRGVIAPLEALGQ